MRSLRWRTRAARPAVLADIVAAVASRWLVQRRFPPFISPPSSGSFAGRYAERSSGLARMFGNQHAADGAYAGVDGVGDRDEPHLALHAERFVVVGALHSLDRPDSLFLGETQHMFEQHPADPVAFHVLPRGQGDFR